MKPIHSMRVLKPVKGLEMVSPERCQEFTKDFNDILKEAKLKALHKRGSTQMANHRRELSWSKDTAIKYIPYQDHKSKPKRNISMVGLSKQEHLPQIVSGRQKTEQDNSKLSKQMKLINSSQFSDKDLTQKTKTSQSEKYLLSRQDAALQQKRALLLEVGQLYLRDQKQIDEIFKKIPNGQRHFSERLLTAKLHSQPHHSRYPSIQSLSTNNGSIENELSNGTNKLASENNRDLKFFDKGSPTIPQALNSTNSKSQQREYKMNKKLKRVLFRYKMVVQFWKKVRSALSKKKEITDSAFPQLLKEAIPSSMAIIFASCKSDLLKLFREAHMLIFYLSKPSSTEFMDKKKKLTDYAIDIMQGISSGVKKMGSNESMPFLKLITMHSHSYDFAPPKFWPEFVLKRLHFTAYGALANVTASQREMIALLFFISYGLFNRLVSPWLTLQIEESEVITKNSQLILSVIFYALFDYLKGKNNITEHSQQELLLHKPLQRAAPLIAYKDLVSIEMEKSLKAKKSQKEEDKIISQQTLENEGIIAGISSRKCLSPIVDQDDVFKKRMSEYFEVIAKELLVKADEIYSQNKITLKKLLL